jgi:hypothetical protein
MLKKFFLFAAMMVFATAASADCLDNYTMDGDPGFFWCFDNAQEDIFAGQTLCFEIAPANFGWISTLCPDPDTFCVHGESEQGWTITGEDLNVCFILDPATYTTMDFCITCPCEVEICDYDTVYATMAFCDTNGICAPECGDCEDNFYSGAWRYNIDTLLLHVVQSPPALYIVQDSLYEISYGQTSAFVPFDVCNGDPCAPPTTYGYTITAAGTNIPGAQQGATVVVDGGECEPVYWVGDAGATPPCTYEELTIIVWSTTPPLAYDTCVQLVHVIERKSVPLFTAPVVTILVLAMILTAAVFMRRRAAGKM